MPLISASVDVFLVLAAAVSIPAFLFFRPRLQQPWTPTFHGALTLLALADALSLLYTLVVRSPPNLFSRLDIPLTTPSDSIRAILLQRTHLPDDAPLPRPLDTLLTRLASFDTRILYVRFGQAVIQDCEHCTTFDEYAIFAAPRIALSYVKQAVVLGLLTIRGSGHERWRTYTVASLVFAFILESYWLSAISIRIPRDGLAVFMWHDALWLLRHLFFLFLPLFLALLSPRAPPPPPPLPALHAARADLQLTHQRLSVTRFLHAAVHRQPALRAASADWWDRQRVHGAWARADDHVRHAARKLGKGIDTPDAPLAHRAKDVVRQFFNALALRPPPPSG